ncbi:MULTISPECIES: endonuclease NucS [unclassified Microbacterium]|uniref:endonuclease NucS n=1 Tax=unclassified Microbacterium TaxID=2609290 RepID=UPI0006F39F63|nr:MULTISPECIES: endonuclease NucS [unclassified Microbacterium]MBD8207466.1 endonuclease NucS [Microbacterium sp. CFBP 8801]MBD8217356.1 endonuclease NucS [Microbacterium sp. CFBP 13617]MBD8477116.1 endonuclease NucS [Microbacterium sp. CFBP 8794]MBD8509026.1 endonuclease NucS [Microbacterium sp. CFBP 8790]AOX45862.1 endonuclease [Microbacterium sp. BH-3-3-3]
MRLVIARCSVDYTGRLNAHLPLATRLLVHKGDGSLLVHSDGGSYKPLNWMSPPCSLTLEQPDEADVEDGVIERWRVTHAKTGDALLVRIHEVVHDSSHELGVDPGLIKDGVEADLQRLLAEQVSVVGEGLRLVRREYPTAIGPVDLLLRDDAGGTVAIEVKRRGDIDGVEQLTRYLELLNRDPLLAPVTGIFAAQEIKPQARVLATDRGIRCLTLDYDEMKGVQSGAPRLF